MNNIKNIIQKAIGAGLIQLPAVTAQKTRQKRTAFLEHSARAKMIQEMSLPKFVISDIDCDKLDRLKVTSFGVVLDFLKKNPYTSSKFLDRMVWYFFSLRNEGPALIKAEEVLAAFEYPREKSRGNAAFVHFWSNLGCVVNPIFKKRIVLEASIKRKLELAELSEKSDVTVLSTKKDKLIQKRHRGVIHRKNGHT